MSAETKHKHEAQWALFNLHKNISHSRDGIISTACHLDSHPCIRLSNPSLNRIVLVVTDDLVSLNPFCRVYAVQDTNCVYENTCAVHGFYSFISFLAMAGPVLDTYPSVLAFLCGSAEAAENFHGRARYGI